MADAMSGFVAVTLLPPTARFSVRVRDADRAAAEAALGLPLPTRIGHTARAAGREALCLGPDEWLVVAPEGERDAIVAAVIAAPHSLVEISAREVSYGLTGGAAAELLTLGCPRDPEAIAPGEGARTVFDGVSIVLWRRAADAFQIDVWRSFAPHVAHLLAKGNAELAAGL